MTCESRPSSRIVQPLMSTGAVVGLKTSNHSPAVSFTEAGFCMVSVMTSSLPTLAPAPSRGKVLAFRIPAADCSFGPCALPPLELRPRSSQQRRPRQSLRCLPTHTAAQSAIQFARVLNHSLPLRLLVQPFATVEPLGDVIGLALCSDRR